MQLLAGRNLEMLLILQKEAKELLCFDSLFQSFAKCVSIYHEVIMRKHVIIYVAK